MEEAGGEAGEFQSARTPPAVAGSEDAGVAGNVRPMAGRPQ